jgi:threonine synthase
MTQEIICTNCNAVLSSQQRSLTCPICSATAVGYRYSIDNANKALINHTKQGIWRYEQLLPSFSEQISLDEGNTPLRTAQTLFNKKINLLLKVEGKNPTGSFLDRVSPLMVSDALANDMSSVVCASDGNLGASISAYCATAGLKSVCVVPKSTSPEKKTQMIAYGAEVIDYGETIDDSLKLATKMVDEESYQGTPEFNILATEGIKTIALEMIDQYYLTNDASDSGPLIDYVVVPVGSGSLLQALWMGFKQAKKYHSKKTFQLPKIIGVQLEGNDPITLAFKGNKDEPAYLQISARSMKNKLGDAILARHSIFGTKAIASIKESGGLAISVSEKEMLEASQSLGTKEGVFAELSSATVIAGVEKLVQDGFFNKNTTVLALITASGLKTSGAFQQRTSPQMRLETFRGMGTKIEILRIIREDTSNEANFGYGIWKAMNESLSLQAIYQHLKELLDKELISEIPSTGRQKRYQLTLKGEQLIQKMGELEKLLY